eukprot:c19045_g1_i3.p1 GENE.c19045_g1_i3~~c19045_g1_i3.p1  ORF type:complete len:615 (+),score=162.72 c19045_g1_i3:30-1847(+)
MAEQTSVLVACRFRPFNDREQRLGMPEASPFRISPTQVTVVSEFEEDRVFPLSKCFSMECTQDQIFRELALPPMGELFKGYNVTLLAYGQTGSGKTYSMFGDIRNPEQQGIVPRCCETIFSTIPKLEHAAVSVSCTYCEIYQEQICDLLVSDKVSLELREHPTRGVYVEGLSQRYTTSSQEIYNAIALGEAHKTKRATKMNLHSSRSHTVLCIRIEIKDSSTGVSLSSRLNLVDLAGSERISKTAVEGIALEEAKLINLSLTTLSRCIQALTDPSATHVPYRQSKLTRLLQESLGGSSKTTMLIACSPHPNNVNETINSLRFAQRCANVKNLVRVNIEQNEESLRATLEALTEELSKLRAAKGYTRPQMVDVGCDLEAEGLDQATSDLEAQLIDVEAELEVVERDLHAETAARLAVAQQIDKLQLQLDSMQERSQKDGVDALRRSTSMIRRESIRQIKTTTISAIREMPESARSPSPDSRLSPKDEMALSKLDKQIEEYERQLATLETQHKEELNMTAALQRRLDEQGDVIERQNEIREGLEMDTAQLKEERRARIEEIEQIKQQAAKVQAELEKRRLAEEEERRRKAEEEGLLGGVVNIFKGLF